MDQAGFRAAVLDALVDVAQVASGEWACFAQPPDALQPPAYFLQWVDPMRAVQTMCTDTAQLEVYVVTARLSEESNYDLGDAMVDAAHTALVANGLRPWQSLAPAPTPIASLTYWAARIQIRQPVTVGGT
jgi:hypothetical protein